MQTLATALLLLAAGLVMPGTASAASTEGAVELSVVGPNGLPDNLARFDVMQRIDGSDRWYPLLEDVVGDQVLPGRYRIIGIPESTVRIFVRSYDRTKPAQDQAEVGPVYYPGVAAFSDATDIKVTAGQTTSLSTVHLPVSGRASGRVTPVTQELNSSNLEVRRWNGAQWLADSHVSVDVSPNGSYSLSHLGPGPYQLWFGGTPGPPFQGNVAQSFWTDQSSDRVTLELSRARSFTAPSGGTRNLQTSRRTLNGHLSGRLLSPTGAAITGRPLAVADRDFEDVTTDASGSWNYGRTHPGRYRLVVNPAVPLALGYPVEPMTFSSNVALGQDTTFTTRLRHAPPVLSTVRMNFEDKAPIAEQVFPAFSVFPADAKMSYQWFIQGRGRTAIKGATRRGYTPTDSLAKKRIGVRVTATAYGKTTVAYSVARPTVRDESALTPRPDRPFGVVSHTYVGPSSWLSPAVGSPSLPEFGRWQWYRDTQPISGATSPTYVSTAEDVGHRISGMYLAPGLEGPFFGAARWTRASTKTVRARPVVKAGGRGKGHGSVVMTAMVRIAAVAPEYTDGTAVFYRKVGSTYRELGRFTVKDQRVDPTFQGQPRGKQVYQVRYLPQRRGHDGAASKPFTIDVT